MIKEAIEKLVNKQDLTFDEAKEVMNEIMSGETPDTLISAYLVALRMKGETIEEISGSARGMRDNGTKLLHDMDVLEIVGTGGDKANTFNISTTSAFVAAAAGCKVAKHGNRGVSSKSGAADVLEALGANITVATEKSKELLDKVGFCFLFAQKYHPAMRFVGPVRGELRLRTIFNVLGPLTNPAGASMEIIGVYEEELVEPIAKVLLNLGVKKGMVVFGQDTMDEITPSAKTTVCEIRNGETKSYEINPEEYGISICKKSDLEGGDGTENAQVTKDILSGKLQGPKRDAVLLNAGACIYVQNDDLTYEEAINIARETIDSGKAKEKLQDYIEESNK
ncbi:anthranilate phosphoribosyltransferase [uncultured Eubacterium sp.]|uniref:anthranilate phosphoribosyltransferase n=1 Tax=uncultured Eubacterium sp. TaxID=165185 RepID=UPI00260D3C83|nr:anthranilate phosphoribosyltransferase [uncultured Eubacterium sp.]